MRGPTNHGDTVIPDLGQTSQIPGQMVLGKLKMISYLADCPQEVDYVVLEYACQLGFRPVFGTGIHI